MPETPECYYRVSVKALILDDQGRFLLVKDIAGLWELPGGGLDHGESVEQGLKREIREEMGLELTYIADTPSYFFTVFDTHTDDWICNAVYETEVKNLNVTLTDECLEYRFFDKQSAGKEPLFDNVTKFINVYSPNLPNS